VLAPELQIPAMERGLDFPWRGGLGIGDGSPLHFLPRFQLGPCLGFKLVLSPDERTEDFCLSCAERRFSWDACSVASLLPGEGDIPLQETALFA